MTISENYLRRPLKALRAYVWAISGYTYGLCTNNNYLYLFNYFGIILAHGTKKTARGQVTDSSTLLEASHIWRSRNNCIML